MKWEGREGSENVDDRRRSGGRGKVGTGIGLGTLVMVAIYLLMGQDPTPILQQAQNQPRQQQQQTQQGARADDQLAEFVTVVLKDTETVWNKIFPQQLGKNYKEPTLVLFSGQTESACGYASAATGPFYCPGDQKVYIDLSFYQELKDKFKAPGDFAMAYVVAHEVAHHVQQQLGITQKVHSRKGRVSEKDYNELSVRLELQADFLAGVWAHNLEKMNREKYGMGVLEEGDIEEALNAAHAIGDDRIQKQAQGYVVPDSFTHGTSEQRMRWFTKGLKSGDISLGDTFGVPDHAL